jgi:hypothetical protein
LEKKKITAPLKTTDADAPKNEKTLYQKIDTVWTFLNTAHSALAPAAK